MSGSLVLIFWSSGVLLGFLPGDVADDVLFDGVVFLSLFHDLSFDLDLDLDLALLLGGGGGGGKNGMLELFFRF